MPSDVQIEIDGEYWDYWSRVTLTERADSIAQVELTCNFDATREKFRRLFRPFSYHEMILYVGGEVRFVGTMMGVMPNVTATSSEVSVNAYALCGVLGDVTATPGQFPTEFRNLKFDKLAKALCDPIGINVQIGASSPEILDLDTGETILDLDVEPGTPFEKVQLKPGQKILDLLIELAKQRSLVVTSTFEGDLLIYTPNADVGDIVATLSEDRPVVSVAPNFSVQDYFSSLTGISKTKGGKKGSKFTVNNPKLIDNFDVQRPYVYELNDTDPADVPAAVQARMGRMFADSISYDIDLAAEYDQSGFYWEPNRYITLEAPKAMVYTKTPLYIMESKLIFTPDSKSAKLNCVLPGSLSGDLPDKLPWEE